MIYFYGMSNDHDPLDNIDEELNQLQEQVEIQLLATKRIRELLPEFGGDMHEERELEFFFYADTEEDAKALSAEIEKHKLGKEITIDFFRDSYSVIGLTEKKMTYAQPLEKWIKQMNELAFKFDCEFDGWGSLI